MKAILIKPSHSAGEVLRVLFACADVVLFPQHSQHLRLNTMQMQLKINDACVMDFQHLK